MKNFLILILSTMLSLSVFAQNEVIQNPINSATVEQFVEKLAPEPVHTRSLRNLKPVAKSLDMMIQFDFDSAKLQSSSKPLLDNLAQAMITDKLITVNFKIEGHTDAKGTEQYNIALSNKRAESVVKYLVDKGIDKSRLSSEGKGYSELLFPDKPEAMENRRVRITTVQ